MTKPAKPQRTGQGELIIARQTHPVVFAFHMLAQNRGERLAKGGVTGDPETMREAFRQGRAHLALDDGTGLEISIIAHAEGSVTAYFESTAAPR